MIMPIGDYPIPRRPPQFARGNIDEPRLTPWEENALATTFPPQESREDALQRLGILRFHGLTIEGLLPLPVFFPENINWPGLSCEEYQWARDKGLIDEHGVGIPFAEIRHIINEVHNLLPQPPPYSPSMQEQARPPLYCNPHAAVTYAEARNSRWATMEQVNPMTTNRPWASAVDKIKEDNPLDWPADIEIKL
jgi:hypothetical protein